jgi:hypothetical protein
MREVLNVMMGPVRSASAFIIRTTILKSFLSLRKFHAASLVVQTIF